MGKSILKKRKREAPIRNLYAGWCPQRGGKQWLERINAECITARQFYHRYVKRRMPVILTSSNTGCLKGFSVRALAGIAGDCIVAVEKGDPDSFQPFGRTDAGSRMKMSFGEFLTRMRDEELYCSTQAVPEDRRGPTKVTAAHVQRLVDRGMIPEVLPLMGNLHLHQINAWIGCSEDGSSSGFHHDFHDNFYLLISGEKQFRLSSPNFTEARPTFGCQRSKEVVVHKNGLISYAGSSVREDGAMVTDVLKWKISKNPDNLEELREELEERLLDEMIDQSELGRVSKDPVTDPASFCVESTAQGEFICETIKAGEMLYLPASFYHEVISFNTESEGHNFAVNYWYYPPHSNGSFEQPYEDDYWKERWERLLKTQAGQVRLNRDRMRKHKLPLQFQYSHSEMLRFVKRVENSKQKLNS